MTYELLLVSEMQDADHVGQICEMKRN